MMSSLRGRVRIGAPLAAACLWSALGAASGAEAPDRGASLLGPETLFYAEVSRPDALIDRAAAGRFREYLRAIPGVRDALEGPDVRQFRDVVALVASRLDTNPEQGLRKLTKGGIVVGFEAADPPRIVVVVTPDDPEFLDRTHETLLELARDDARGKGKPDPVTEEDYRDVTTYRLSDVEAHAIIDGRLVVANGESALEAVIDRMLDDGDRLVDDPFFEARRPDDAPMAWAYARIDRLRAVDPDRFGGGDEPDAGAVLLLGGWLDLLQTAPWASASWDWSDDRLAAELTIAGASEGRSEALARFFPPEGQGATTPIDFGGRLATINLWRDMGAIWELREELLPPEALQGLAQLDTFAGQFFGGRDFGDSVLEPLGEQWQLVAADQDYEGMDPEPSLKVPAFALIVEIDADRPEFGQRLRVAFQSLLGLSNLGAAQSGAPPLMLGSEISDGVAIATARYMPAPGPPEDPEAEVHVRHNFSPSIAEVDGRFILASSTPLARTLIEAIRSAAPRDSTDATLLMTADGPALAGLVDLNRERLILRNMLERGNDRAAAERDVAVLAGLLRYLGQGTLRVVDGAEASTLALEFALGDRD